MSAFDVKLESRINGRAVMSYTAHRRGGRKFFVAGRDGEYLTLAAAEEAARSARWIEAHEREATAKGYGA